MSEAPAPRERARHARLSPALRAYSVAARRLRRLRAREGDAEHPQGHSLTAECEEAQSALARAYGVLSEEERESVDARDARASRARKNNGTNNETR